MPRQPRPERRARLARAAAALLALALAGAPAGARAARCPVMAGADTRLAETDGRARLLWIDARLGRVAAAARTWTWGWGLGIGAAGVASLAVVPFVKPEDRVDWYTSAASAAVGVLPFTIAPLAVMRDARELRAEIAAAGADAAPAATSAEADAAVCALLADAEARLRRDAADQELQRGWWTHAGNVAFNTGVVLFLGLGFHHWSSGIINGVAGAAVGEAIILTQPHGTVGDLRAYRAGQLSLGWSGSF